MLQYNFVIEVTVFQSGHHSFRRLTVDILWEVQKTPEVKVYNAPLHPFDSDCYHCWHSAG